MGLFDFAKKKEPEKPKVFKRTYQAANTGRLFADFKDSERSADSELYPALKRIRARSRDLSRNNEYVRRYLNLLKNNVVGPAGIGLQVKATDPTGGLDQTGNQAIEDAFKKWGRRGNCTVNGSMSWVEAQKMALEALARDGEVFIVMHRSNSFHDTFAIEFIEADQVDEEKSERLPNGNEIRMGVEIDKFRRPVAYHFLTYHPGDYDFTTMSKSKKHIRITADKVLHVYQRLRAGQTRGEPWISPSLSAIKQLDGWREASIIAARMGASKMGFFTSPTGDGFMADEMDGNVPYMEAQPGTFHQLPTGVDFKSFDPQYPTSEFESFHKAVLKGIASGLGISYASLSNDLESTSYSSIRQGALEERDTYRNLQNFLIEQLVRPIFEAWLIAAMENQSFGIGTNKYDKFVNSAEFRGRAWSWVDPQKEMTAAVLGMQNGILSLQDVASQYGKDTEELLAQIQRDKALMQQFDVQYDLEPYAAKRDGSQDQQEDAADDGERELNSILADSLKRVFSE
jgi:lambda family phage portal protein